MTQFDKNNADFIVHSISHNTLDKEDADILRKAVKKIKDKQEKHFLESLENASRIVASWPKWKRELGLQILRPSRPPK